MNRYLTQTVKVVAIAGILGGCDALNVSDPTVVEQRDVATATGAELLWRDAVVRLYRAINFNVYVTGTLSDELMGGAFLDVDARDPSATGGSTPYQSLNDARHAASIAISQARQSGAAATRRARVGELFAVRGFATVILAESFCAGFPLHDVVDFKPVFGEPLTTDGVFERALVDFDSAAAAGADSARIANLARIGRGRALLGLGRFADAATAVRDVPTAFEWNAEYSSIQLNTVGDFTETQDFLFVGDNEGTNGIDYVSAQDPRLPVIEAYSSEVFPDLEDQVMYYAAKYANNSAPITIASGVEARLIEAEAALQTGSGAWLGILNELRAGESMPALNDPGTASARVDLLMRERAFWLWGTAHRLGDLRRMVARYDRAPDTVYPTGPYYQYGIFAWRDGNYGTGTSLRFPAELEAQFSPNVTGCTDQ